MSEISAINSSFYPSLIDSVSPLYTGKSSFDAVEPVQKNYEEDRPPVDLSGYYNELESSGLIEQVGQNVIQSAKVLDNAMAAAIENGYSVQDAVNIKLAQTAYKANCFVMKSTFELKI
ncbi:MAG: hypothetical protein NC408_01460 [Candidatus Gastranaerophilales bacterium]|nr:hypothetical protein [Candidatus Gastranaerophilales bacterium]MCM1072214.1 hypothetical protein [Bacteroides sp.]